MGKFVKSAALMAPWFLLREPLKSLRGRHAGKRAFLIGNGPSITEVDLTRICDEVSFVTNHFLQHKDIAAIRPTYYCVSDPRFFWPKPNVDWMMALGRLPQTTECFFPVQAVVAYRLLRRYWSGATRFLYYDGRKIWKTGYFETEITKPLYSGDTVLIDFCIPLALYMGVTEIILVGCDMDYGLTVSKDYSSGYFYDVNETSTIRQSAEYHLNNWYENVVTSYEVVKQVLADKSVQIFNATAGGKLEVFPRCSYDDLF